MAGLFNQLRNNLMAALGRVQPAPAPAPARPIPARRRNVQPPAQPRPGLFARARGYIPRPPPIGGLIGGLINLLFGGAPVAPARRRVRFRNPYKTSMTTLYSGTPGKGSRMVLTKKEKAALKGLYY